MNQGSEHETRNVPAAACRFRAGQLQFAAGPDADGRYPVSIVALSGQPIDHWYWGPNTVHDLAGMRRKATVPIDWLHTPEMLGFLNEFSTDGDLRCRGALIPYGEDDIVHKIAGKVRGGVPYEASIDFRGSIRIEELDAGMEAEVNGYTVQGPATIFREWTLRGVAICPYGADPNTRTELAESDDQLQLSVTRIRKEHSMSNPDKHVEEKRGLFTRLAAACGINVYVPDDAEGQASASPSADPPPSDQSAPGDEAQTAQASEDAQTRASRGGWKSWPTVSGGLRRRGRPLVRRRSQFRGGPGQVHGRPQGRERRAEAEALRRRPGRGPPGQVLRG